MLYIYIRTGLQLILNLNQLEYLEETGDTAGARVVIHQQRTMPFPEDDGIMLLPGKAQALGIRKASTPSNYFKHNNLFKKSHAFNG